MLTHAHIDFYRTFGFVVLPTRRTSRACGSWEF